MLTKAQQEVLDYFAKTYLDQDAVARHHFAQIEEEAPPVPSKEMAVLHGAFLVIGCEAGATPDVLTTMQLYLSAAFKEPETFLKAFKNES